MAKGKSVKDVDAEKAKAEAKKVETEKKAERTVKTKKEEKKGMRVVVRVLGTDLDGERGVQNAILKIRGVGHTFAKAVCETAKIDPKRKLGSFTESEISDLEEVIKDPTKFGIPAWIVNRRRDMETGEDMHKTSSDVDVSKKFDVQRMIDKKSYKGVRHMLGLPVRGQRTKSSFRKGKTVGVVRRAARIAASPKTKKK